jgi:CubicO group peptidase (beta-lactamase class C family)
MMKNKIIGFIIVLLILISGFSCGGGGNSGEDNTYQYYNYQIPENTGDGWLTGSLETVGMSVEPLKNLMEILLNRESHEIHCILVIKDDLLVFEEYFAGHDFSINNTSNYHGAWINFNRDTPHNLHSVTKSITSTLLGIAIDNGFIAGVEEKVYDFFPDYDSLRTEIKDRILLRHLLNMRAGWEWNEGDVEVTSLESNYIQMLFSDDPLGYVLGRPMAAEPGTLFHYSGGVTNVLGQVIERSVMMDFENFADEYLFNHLGITNRSWCYFPSGIILVSGDLHIRPRDMAKIGCLFINNGKWKESQVVSPDWINEATQKRVDLPDPLPDGYGYHWWFQTFMVNGIELDSFYASGWGGQLIIMVPDLKMIVVFTGANYVNPLFPDLRTMLEEYILLSAF